MGLHALFFSTFSVCSNNAGINKYGTLDVGLGFPSNLSRANLKATMPYGNNIIKQKCTNNHARVGWDV